MIIADRVRNYVASRNTAPVCDACIAAKLELRHQQANRVTMALGTTSDFSRGYGTCADCGRVQKVTALTSPNQPLRRNEFSKHEALHTAYIASDFFDRHLLEHDAVVSNPELKRAATEVSYKLAEFYQLCGKEFV